MGVGTSQADVEAAELMALALAAAAGDAGAPSLLGAVDRVLVPQGTWSYTDPARLLAVRVGLPGAADLLSVASVSPSRP